MNPFIPSAYETLFERWGEQHWWPAPTQLEMMIGAILTQNTAWTNVERALTTLRKHQALNLQSLDKVSQEELAKWIRPAGYFNQKSGYIKGMVETVQRDFDGSIPTLFALDTPTLRKELLSWKGIGPETADSILLYAGKRPVFVVDTYTKRFLSRHGKCNEKATYDSVAKIFTAHLPEDAQLYNEYHALIVRLGKEYCKTKPQCKGCPLERITPTIRTGNFGC